MTPPLQSMTRYCSLLLALLALACAAGPASAAKPTAPAQTATAGKATTGTTTTGKAAARKAATNKLAAEKAASKAAADKAAAAKAAVDGEPVNFHAWQAVADFEAAMVSKHGFTDAALAQWMQQVSYIDAAVQLVKPAPPGKPKNWQAYRARFVEPVRIDAGVAFWAQNADALARAATQYGVPAEIIVAIIGVETVYGRNTGRFRVMDVLTTLAFAYPETPNRAARMAFFRGELEATLLLARAGQYDPFSLIGSFAGAVGLPQFMPGSILAYGVDFDGDGHIDLRNSASDAIGSVANFLVQHGWRASQAGPLAFPATVSPAREWERFLGQGLAATFSAEQLAGAGALGPAALPTDRLFGLIDLQNGAEATEYYLASDNFFAITQYNRSYFYAMSVVELAQAVRLARGT